MAKWDGYIGFSENTETKPGVWEPVITEHYYFGDVIENRRSLQPTNNVNDKISVNNTISIIADPYANQNFHAIKYITFMGTRWKVSSVNVQYPRLILSLGEVYNGKIPTRIT